MTFERENELALQKFRVMRSAVDRFFEVSSEETTMATGKICDRYRTAKDVGTYDLMLSEIKEGATGKKLIQRRFDLGPRGLAWLTNLIEHDIAKLDGGEVKADDK